jgi:two-component system phosphate regulon sensor histidine kinase PhoR
MNIDEHRSIVDALQSTIEDQKHVIDALQSAQTARDQAVAALRSDYEQQRRDLEALRAATQSHEQALARAQAELKTAEARLSETTEALKSADADADYKLILALTLANAAYDALLVLDEDKRVIAINNSAETLFERTRPIGQPLVEVTDSPELESIVDDAMMYSEESFEEQLTLRRRPHRVRAQVITRNGHRFIGLALQDVSELVRLNRARRDMVANISHELRTPIANIRLTIDSIFHEQEKPKGKASRSALKVIARETDSLLWLVQELLDLSMIESGQAILRMVDVPADMLVEEAIERMTDLSETKNLTIVSDVPVGIQVLCDRDQARRVLINLIHNAIKWSPANETITVRVMNGSDEVTFSVLDNGPGVPEDHRERIFERFYQVDTSRSGGEGTGLGLAICKHIVEAHGGRIWAESNANGGGGKFVFTLPGVTEPVDSPDTSKFA